MRQTAMLPPYREVEKIRVIEPATLAALKAIAIAARGGHEKSLSDKLDLHRLLRTFPELRAEGGPVALRLSALGASAEALAAWRDIAQRPPASDDDEH